VLDHRPGTTWLADRVADLWQRRRPHVVTDSGDPGKDTTRQLQARRVKVEELPTGDYTAACAELVTALHTGTLTYRADAALLAAAGAAKPRGVGDRWLFDRRVAVDVSPVTAAACAVYRARRPAAVPVMV